MCIADAYILFSNANNVLFISHDSFVFKGFDLLIFTTNNNDCSTRRSGQDNAPWGAGVTHLTVGITNFGGGITPLGGWITHLTHLGLAGLGAGITRSGGGQLDYEGF